MRRALFSSAGPNLVDCGLFLFNLQSNAVHCGFTNCWQSRLACLLVLYVTLAGFVTINELRQVFVTGLYVWTLRTPRRPPKQKPDAPENQQRQLCEVRDQPAPPRLAVRF